LLLLERFAAYDLGILMSTSQAFHLHSRPLLSAPRENPWLETVETQDSAAPYHDWNERICAECYAPNARLACSM